MKSKKLLILFLSLVPLFAMAQQSEEVEEANTKYGPYLTNRFADNWFVGVNVGGLWNSSGLFKFKAEANFTPDVEAYFGKWIDPCWGLRVGYAGWAIRNIALSDQWYQTNHLHFDVMWNWSNQFGGYKRDRVYSAIPYLHSGIMFGHFGNDFVLGAGLFNDFRLTNNWHMNIDLRGDITHGKMDGSGGRYAGFLVLSVGATYHFNKADWNRPAKQKPTIDPQEYAALESSNIYLADENKELSKRVRELEDNLRRRQDNGEAVTDTVYVEKERVVRVGGGDCDVSGPATFYFNYGRKVLSQQERQHFLYYIANVIDKDTENSNQYVVTGYADQQTGSRAANRRMSLLRAQYIRKLMIEAGVEPEQISINVGKGKNLGETATLSRAAVIEIVTED